MTAAPLELPRALLEQLAKGGILVAPIGEAAHSRLARVRKVKGLYVQEDLGAVAFVEMRTGVDRVADL